MREIYLALKDILDERHMTRYMLSKQTGIQYQTVDKYYKNKVSKYDRSILERFCTVLDCSIHDLIQMEEEKKET